MADQERPLSDHELRKIRLLLDRWGEIQSVLNGWKDVLAMIEADRRVKWLFSGLRSGVVYMAAVVVAIGTFWEQIKVFFGIGGS